MPYQHNLTMTGAAVEAESAVAATEASSSSTGRGSYYDRKRKIVDPKLYRQVIQTAKDRTKTSLSISTAGNDSESQQPIPVVAYSQLTTGKLLGTGSFSSGIEIKSVRGKECENLVMKKLRPEVLRSPLVFAACAADLKQEGRILAFLSNHPNIVQLKAWSGEHMIEDYLKGSFVSSYLLLERLHETLEERITKWHKQTPTFWHKFSKRNTRLLQLLQTEKCTHITNLAKALAHCHEFCILHRDLKTPNIGFDANGTLKVFDFDLARVLPSNSNELTFHLTANVGSPRYMAPEVSAGEDYNLKADVFSFGVLVHHMLTCKKPYGGMDRDWNNAKYMPMEWDTSLRKAMQACLGNSHTDRPSIQSIRDLLEHSGTSSNAGSNDEAEQRSDRETTLRTVLSDF